MSVKPTIPKTHPLYGAVEALVKSYGRPVLPGSEVEWLEPHFVVRAIDAIRALESAGYKVVGPEPTSDMVTAVSDGMEEFMLRETAEALARDTIAAAPTLTEQKP